MIRSKMLLFVLVMCDNSIFHRFLVKSLVDDYKNTRTLRHSYIYYESIKDELESAKPVLVFCILGMKISAKCRLLSIFPA